MSDAATYTPEVTSRPRTLGPTASAQDCDPVCIWFAEFVIIRRAYAQYRGDEESALEASSMADAAAAQAHATGCPVLMCKV